MSPSLSSPSLTNNSGSPTKALANGALGVTKFFITAPFITVGRQRPGQGRHTSNPRGRALAGGEDPPAHAGDGGFAAGATDRDTALRRVEQLGEELRPREVAESK